MWTADLIFIFCPPEEVFVWSCRLWGPYRLRRSDVWRCRLISNQGTLACPPFLHRATAANPEEQRLVVFLCSFSFCSAARSTCTGDVQRAGRTKPTSKLLLACHARRTCHHRDDLLVYDGTLFYTAGWAALIVSHIVLYLCCFVTEYCTRQDALVSIQVLQKDVSLFCFFNPQKHPELLRWTLMWRM